MNLAAAPRRPARPAKPPKLVLREKQIQKTCCDILRADGWRILEFEQQWSEKKRKTVGEKGMPDVLAIRYNGCLKSPPTGDAQVLWVEFKRINPFGKPTRVRTEQVQWHVIERKLGALTWIAGTDFEASIEGFKAHYKSSGLAIRI